MRARDAVNRVVDGDMKNSKAAGSDRWRCVAGANGIERGIVPVGRDIATGWDADAGCKIYSADARYEKRTSENRAD